MNFVGFANMLKWTENKKNIFRVYCWLFVLAAMLSFVFTSYVNSFVDYMLPYGDVIVRVWDVDRQENVEWRNIKFVCNKGAVFYDAKYNVYDLVVEATADKIGEVSFKVKQDPAQFFAVQKTDFNWQLIIKTRKDKQVINLHESTIGNDIKIYPYRNSHLKVIYKVGIYSLLTAVLFVLLCLIDRCFRAGSLSKAKDISYSKSWTFLFVWLALFILAMYEYRRGIPNFLTLGDQCGYWNSYILQKGTILNFHYLLYTPRGWMNNILPSISHYVGRHFDIDPVYIYEIFPSLVFSYMSTVCIPGIYEIVSHKKTTLIQVVMFILIFMLLWNGYLTAVLSDLYAVVGFISFIFAILNVMNYEMVSTQRFLYAALAGLSASIACNFRVSYSIAFAISILLILLRAIILNCKHKCEFRKILQRYLCIVIVVMVFIVVCIPQLKFNINRGHFSLLPYTTNNDWLGRNLTECIADISLTNGFVLCPRFIGDAQLLTMKDKVYAHNDKISIAQIFDVYAESPMETFICVFKKLFTGLDKKSSIVYLDEAKYEGFRTTPMLLFSFLNYFVLGSAFLFILLSHKMYLSEKAFFILIMIGIVLPQMFVHIEWRFVFALHIFLFYIFAFRFVPDILLDKQEYECFADKYYLFLSIIMFLSYALSLTLWS